MTCETFVCLRGVGGRTTQAAEEAHAAFSDFRRHPKGASGERGDTKTTANITQWPGLKAESWSGRSEASQWPHPARRAGGAEI